jgi:tRNA-dihydrouridine synthase B
MQAISVHGRTRSQAYRGEANWEVIDECARSVSVPVIGNGDIASGADLAHRRQSTAVSGVMIGRAAMQNPWIFREAKHYLQTGEQLPAVPIPDRWELIRRHCRLAIEGNRYGSERNTMMAMRSRLMAYCKGFPGARPLRQQLATVGSVTELEEIAGAHLARLETGPLPASATA